MAATPRSQTAPHSLRRNQPAKTPISEVSQAPGLWYCTGTPAIAYWWGSRTDFVRFVRRCCTGVADTVYSYPGPPTRTGSSSSGTRALGLYATPPIPYPP